MKKVGLRSAAPTFFLFIRYVLHPSRACTQATESFRYSRAWLAP